MSICLLIDKNEIHKYSKHISKVHMKALCIMIIAGLSVVANAPSRAELPTQSSSVSVNRYQLANADCKVIGHYTDSNGKSYDVTSCVDAGKKGKQETLCKKKSKGDGRKNVQMTPLKPPPNC